MKDFVQVASRSEPEGPRTTTPVVGNPVMTPVVSNSTTLVVTVVHGKGATAVATEKPMTPADGHSFRDLLREATAHFDSDVSSCRHITVRVAEFNCVLSDRAACCVQVETTSKTTPGILPKSAPIDANAIGHCTKHGHTHVTLNVELELNDTQLRKVKLSVCLLCMLL